MALLLSQHKMIDSLTKQISKHKSLDNNNCKEEVKKAKEEERLEDLGRENKHDYIRKNERINLLMTSSKRRLCRPTIYLK
jgi:hypothetical protein